MSMFVMILVSVCDERKASRQSAAELKLNSVQSQTTGVCCLAKRCIFLIFQLNFEFSFGLLVGWLMIIVCSSSVFRE